LDILPPAVAFGPARQMDRIIADTVTHPLVLSGGGSPMQIDGRSTRTVDTTDVSS
jgi:hypothetical protein